MSELPHAPDTRPSLLLRLRDVQDAQAREAFGASYAPLRYRYCRRQGLQDADAADMPQLIPLGRGQAR